MTAQRAGHGAPRRRVALAAGLLCMVRLVPVPAAGQDLHVLEARALATPPGARTAVVYVTIHNVGATPDRLMGARTPLAGSVELHAANLQGGVMRMRPLAALPLPVGGSIEMHSGGTHLMLLGLTHALRAGEQFTLTLQFERAGALPAIVSVAAMGAAAQP